MSEIKYADIFNNIERWLVKIISRKLNSNSRNNHLEDVREKVRRNVILEILPHLQKILKENKIHEDKLRAVWESKMRKNNAQNENIEEYSTCASEDSAASLQNSAEKFCKPENDDLKTHSQTDILTSGAILRSKLSTIDEEKETEPNVKDIAVSISDSTQNCYEWMRDLIHYVFDQECKNETSDDSDVSTPREEMIDFQGKTYNNELDSVLMRSLSELEKEYLNNYFTDLLPGVLEEMIDDKPENVKKYLGRYILLHKYSEIREDLNINDIEHLVELRENEVKGLTSSSPYYLCKLLNDKKLYQKRNSSYRFELSGKIKVVRGKRLQPKIKKICNFFIENAPSHNLSKKIRRENVQKDVKTRLSDLLLTLRREVYVIKQTEKSTIYEEIMTHLVYVLPDISDMQPCKLDREERKPAYEVNPKRCNTANARSKNLGAIAIASERNLRNHRLHMQEEFGMNNPSLFGDKVQRARTAPLTSNTHSLKDRTSFLPPLTKAEPNLIVNLRQNYVDISLDDKTLNSFNVQSVARCKAFASYSLDTLPSVNKELRPNLIKVNRLTSMHIMKLLENVEEKINNKTYGIESLKQYEKDYVQSEMSSILHNILDLQYQDKITRTFNYKDILEIEVLPLLETVLEFENDADKYILGDQIKVYLKQIMKTLNEELTKKKRDEMAIAQCDIMKMLGLFISNINSISATTNPGECVCVDKLKDAVSDSENEEQEYEEPEPPSDTVVIFHKIAYALEELSLNYRAVNQLLQVTKTIIAVGTGKKSYVTNKTINDVERMVRLCKQIFRLAQPSDEEKMEFAQSKLGCGGCILRRSCAEIGRVLERADRMFELRRLQQREELQSEINRMFSAFVVDPCSSRRHKNFIYCEPYNYE